MLNTFVGRSPRWAGPGLVAVLLLVSFMPACSDSNTNLPNVPRASMFVSVEPNPVLLEAASKLMHAMHWHGVAMVEFKHNPQDGTYALMEVNGRFWGSLPLCIAAGADFPRMLYELLVHGPLGGIPKVRYGVFARKLATDLQWYEMVLRRQGDPTIVTFPGKRQLLKDAVDHYGGLASAFRSQLVDQKTKLAAAHNTIQQETAARRHTEEMLREAKSRLLAAKPTMRHGRAGP